MKNKVSIIALIVALGFTTAVTAAGVTVSAGASAAVSTPDVSSAAKLCCRHRLKRCRQRDRLKLGAG